MPLSSGAQIGHYEILSPLGAGGMGEVYRGHDARLGRDVAIKILPPDVSAHPDRLRRFEQEARSASALNHPNIITIYDIGAFNSTSYIAMEFVDGKTLRELLHAGAIPVRKAVQMAVQLAEGLAKAHEAGIIHRDLKPENIMITKDGYVKILDFGLAKLLLPSNDQVSALPTNAQTDAGTVLGTVGYMSPEQATGGDIDFRSDQFSFGAILYEMVTGKRAFHKKSGVETLAAIIQSDPEPVGSSGFQVPAPVRWILERCLEKNPADRYASTRDLARDLQSIRDHFSEVTVSETLTTLPAVPASKRSLHRTLVAATILLIILLSAATAYFALRSAKPVETKPLNYHRLTYRRGPIQSARFTSDGQTIVYSASFGGQTRELYQTRPDRVESRALGISGAEVLSISRTGEMLILLFGQKLILAQVPLTGGSPRELAEDISAADWTPDGNSMVIARTSQGKTLLECPPGKVLYQTANRISEIRTSPDGKSIAFLENTTGGINGTAAIMDYAGKEIARSKPLYPAGLFWKGDESWFVTFSEAAGGGFEVYGLALSGSLRLVQRYPGGTNLFDCAQDSRLLMGTTDSRSILMVEKKGDPIPREFSWLDQAQVADFSPDGKNILIWERGEGSESPSGTIYLRPLDGSAAVRLAAGAPTGFSPDGKWVVGDSGGKQILLVPVGAGEIKTFPFQEYESASALGFMPDGKEILITARDQQKQLRIYLQDLKSGKLKPVGAAGMDALAGKPISPDGRFVLAIDTEDKIFYQPTDGGQAKLVSGLEGGERPFQWTQDGSSILAYDRRNVPAKIYKINVASGKRELLKEIIPPDLAGISGFASLLFSPDETIVAYSYNHALSTLYLVEGVN